MAFKKRLGDDRVPKKEMLDWIAQIERVQARARLLIKEIHGI